LFSLKDYFFELQLIINVFVVTAVIILAFFYLKISSSKSNTRLLEKIEYLCKNLQSLVDQSENSYDNI